MRELVEYYKDMLLGEGQRRVERIEKARKKVQGQLAQHDTRLYHGSSRVSGGLYNLGVETNTPQMRAASQQRVDQLSLRASGLEDASRIAKAKVQRSLSKRAIIGSERQGGMKPGKTDPQLQRVAARINTPTIIDRKTGEREDEPVADTNLRMANQGLLGGRAARRVNAALTRRINNSE
jgi:hypothetical protein